MQICSIKYYKKTTEKYYKILFSSITLDIAFIPSPSLNMFLNYIKYNLHTQKRTYP